MSILSERLVALRKANSLSQEVAAHKFGVMVRAYQRYEYGEQDPKLATLIKIADFYGVTLDYLVGRSDYMENQRRG